MGKLFIGGLAGIILVLVVEFLFLTQGGLPVATKGGPLPLEEFLASRALANAIAKEGERPSPVPADEPNLIGGARVYRAQCAVCHGAPGQLQPSAIARGMFPRPPQLMPPGKGVTDDPVGETYWKVKNGIRLTGMPGFQSSLSDTEIWQVSQLLVKADRLPERVKRALQESGSGGMDR